MLEKLVQPFLEQRPDCVLVRATLERRLSPTRLDRVFREHAAQQYERELLFSSLVEVMARVVPRIERSVLSSSRALREKLGVSDEAVDQKLRLVEGAVSAAMVRDRSWLTTGGIAALNHRLIAANPAG